MNAFLDGLFEKFLPGWKTRLTAIILFLIGLYPCGTAMEGMDPGLAGGILCTFGVTVPGWVYTTMYALGLLGVGEKANALVKSNALMALIEKDNTSKMTLAKIEEAKPGATQLPGEKPPSDQ